VPRALLSVYDKTGLDDFARGLAELGWELVASGGTATHLEGLGLDVTRVEEVTEAPEMLGGHVKTLHPRIHGAILARPDRDDDRDTLDEQEIVPFELVCVNLYPFGEHETVEMIDVGGPSLLRGAAKNFEHVAPVSRPDQYAGVLAEVRRDGAVSPGTRRRLAAEAFATTAAYEASIADWFAAADPFPRRLTLSVEKAADLAYGENPHQRAAFYGQSSSVGEQLHGKPLSYNNLNDLSAARSLLAEQDVPACVIVKHANPCGVAIAATPEEAYERALAADPVSAYGGVVVLNRAVSAELGARLAEQFVEVLFAPGYDDSALEALRAKPGTRILDDRERRRGSRTERDVKRVLGGLLVQDRDWELEDRDGMEVVCGSPSEAVWGDLLFAWRVCRHVTSNAIVIARELQTIGVGAGQMSRVDSVRIAVDKARELGHRADGAVLASDAFFPFADGPRLALEAGVTAIIQPGGSKRDDEVIEAVSSAGATMVFTHRRHFRH
jgi:phosphoribosylaminoimidazolecarboxamide formyltransferase / IMP cyclohydrolase